MRGHSNNPLIVGVTAITLAAWLVPVIAAANTADYAAEYRLYNEALAQGDNAAAATHALAAWRAAEETSHFLTDGP